MSTNPSSAGFGGNSRFASPAQANIFRDTPQMFGVRMPTFSQARGNIFGQQPQQNQLFSSANASAENSFAVTPLQNTQSSTSLFGTPSTFGPHNNQPDSPFPTPQSGASGQTATMQQPQQASNMLLASTSSNCFGMAAGMAQQSGTAIKFQLLTGIDFEPHNNTALIKANHHCITYMKEYENMSFEELRTEDYAANRGGPQAERQGAFGLTPPAQPFALPSGGGTFGTAGDPKMAFGQPSGPFDKPAFGSTISTSTAGGGFGIFGTAFGVGVAPQPATNMFSAHAQQQAKPFGKAAPLFNYGVGGGVSGQRSKRPVPIRAKRRKSPQTGFDFSTGLLQLPKTTGFSFQKKNNRKMFRMFKNSYDAREFTVATRKADLPHQCETVTELDYAKMSSEQEDDLELHEELLKVNPVLTLKRRTVPDSQTQVYCDVYNDHIRPYVPKGLRRQVFVNLHTPAHLGTRASKAAISGRFVWHGMNKDITQWCRECIACQRSKIIRHAHAPAPTSDKRFDHIHVGIIGPLPGAGDLRFLLTIIDRLTGWPEAVPMNDISPGNFATNLMSRWISIFGVPSTITTDRDSLFETTVFNQLNQMLGINHLKVTARHPQSNRLVERFHRTLKAFLVAEGETDWTQSLPLVLLALRNALKVDLGCSSAKMVFGKPLKLPSGLFEDNSTPAKGTYSPLEKLRSKITKIEQINQEPPDGGKAVFIYKDLLNCTHVFIRSGKGLTYQYEGPFTVVQRTEMWFLVQRQSREEKVSIQRLKPAFMQAEMKMADEHNDPVDTAAEPSSGSCGLNAQIA